ncbi:hypothetical protein BDV96DRAFT_574255 [Lophiotrema nucula]|uniref:Uncharacterized protein n=1 Tax=Lophiotrema nucula TaxID=690887 RepID=A0A6A5Z813_9PLEO|nr:hypothetical protein BDV96DRAFT_574255 [Lophiotrema nucula]
MSVTYTFGPPGTWFFESPSMWRMRNLPPGLNQLFAGPSCEVAHSVELAFGENGSYVFAYKNKNGMNSITANNIPPSLHAFLFAKSPQGRLIRDIANLEVTLGPNGSYFATDLKSSAWANLPVEMERYLQSIRNAQGQLTQSFRCVQLGINGNYMAITMQHGGCWDVSSYPALDQLLTGVKLAAGNQGGMFKSIKYVWLDSHDTRPQEGHWMVFDSSNNSQGEVPDDALQDCEAIMNSIPTLVTTPTSTSNVGPSPSQNPGSPSSVLNSGMQLTNGVANLANIANGGSGSGGGADSGVGGVFYDQLQQFDWSSLQAVALAAIQ